MNRIHHLLQRVEPAAYSVEEVTLHRLDSIVRQLTHQAAVDPASTRVRKLLKEAKRLATLLYLTTS